MHRFPAHFAADKGKEENERLTVVSYVMATGVAYDMSRNKRQNLTSAVSRDEARLARLAWASLRDARVFHFHPFHWLEVYHHMDRFTTEVITGLNWEAPKFDGDGFQMEPDPRLESESAQYTVAYLSAITTAPYPEKFPFDSIYIGYGQGMYLSETQAATKFLPQRLPPGVNHVSLLGAVMTSSGYVWEVYKFDMEDGSRGVNLKCWRTPDQGWNTTLDLCPWYLPVLVDIINDHKSFVLEGYPRDLRSMVRHSRKQMGLRGKANKLWQPPDFYRIQLQDKLIQKRLHDNEEPIARHIRFRHDVRGHERCYIKRGLLPLKPEDKADMLARGYKVFEHIKPDDETALRLFKRGHAAKSADEWVAVKTVWIDDHVRGDENLPYVPALRVAKGAG